MSRSLKELILGVKVDDKASKPLKQIGDAADDAKDDLSELNAGLQKLDDASAEATDSIAKLRAEIAKSGDLELVKDLAKQEARLKALARQRKLLVGDGPKPKLPPLPDPDPEETRRFGVAFAAKLGPVIVSALPSALTAGGGVGAAVGAPIVAGLAAWMATGGVGVVLGGAAAGSVAAGLKIAGQDARVQAAAGGLSDAIGEQLENAAAPLVPSTLRAIDTVKVGFHDLSDELGDIFGAAATYVEPFAEAVVGLAREAAPGLRDLVQAAGPVVAVLGDELPEIGRDLGEMLSGVAEHAPEAAQALGLLFDVAGAGIKVVGQSVEIASTAFKYADLFAASFKGPAEFGRVAAEYTNAAAMADVETAEWAGSIQKLGEESTAAAVEIRSLHDVVNDIVDGNLSLAEANLRLADAGEAAAEALDKKKGVSHDEQDTLVGLARALNDTTTALDAQGVSAVQAADHHDANRKQLIAAARAAGYTKEQAEALAAQWLKVPKNVSTTVTSKTTQAKNALASVTRTLDALDGRVANASVYISTYNKNAGPGDRRSMGGRIDGPGPKGVDSLPFMLAPGEYVLSSRDVDRLGGFSAIDEWRKGLHEASRPAATAGSGRAGGGGQAPIVINAAGASGLERMFLTWLIKAVRDAGGNPTVLNL